MKTDAHGYDWFERTNKGISAGDVFSIPLAEGFGFGRVLNTHDGASIAEFFQYYSQDNKFTSEIIEAPRLFSPVGFLVTDITHKGRKRDWQVIHRDPDFYPDDLYDIPFSQSLDGENWTFYTLLDEEKTLGHLSFDKVKSWDVASQLPQHKDRIKTMIENQLRECNMI